MSTTNTTAGDQKQWLSGHQWLALIAALFALVAMRYAPSYATADPERGGGGLGNALAQREEMITQLETLNKRLEKLEKTLKSDADDREGQLGQVERAVRDAGAGVNRRLDKIERALEAQHPVGD